MTNIYYILINLKLFNIIINLTILKIKSLLEKCKSFLTEYLNVNHSSRLLDIMYSYNMPFINIYLRNIKYSFISIFMETLVKFIFLKLSANDLYAFHF